MLQSNPVLLVHPTEPQMQISASLGVVPSVLVQSGAVRQSQGWEKEHDAVEAVFVFQARYVPLDLE